MDYVDVSGTTPFRRIMFVSFQKETFWREEQDLEYTQEDFSMIEDLLGDGNATVTVGLDVKQSVDYGNAAGCSVFIKLTCNQDEETIEKTHAIACRLAEKYVDEGQAKAAKILNRARGYEDEDDDEEVVEEPVVEKKRKSRPSFGRKRG